MHRKAVLLSVLQQIADACPTGLSGGHRARQAKECAASGLQ